MVRERGSDNESQLRYGSEMFANPQNRKDYPAFVLFPQCPPSNFWPFESQPASYDATTFPIDYPTSTPIKLVKELIDSYLQMEEIDKDRIYILGISMGGMGTFDIACRYPETFAAAIPICGGVNVERLDNKVKNIYWRLFHGDADGVVPVNNSRQAYQKLTNIKADAEYIEVPGASHYGTRFLKEKTFYLGYSPKNVNRQEEAILKRVKPIHLYDVIVITKCCISTRTIKRH